MQQGRFFCVIVDTQALATDAQLRYLTDNVPGMQRRRAGRGFIYLDPQGRRITDASELERIKALAIPPAWTDVWISPSQNGHLQATGRDDRGRKQYRYHDRWQEMSNLSKFEGLIEFGRALPRIRRRVAADLRHRQFDRSKVVALVIRLLDITMLRVGNEEYARQNGSFGLTTLRDRHLQVNGSEFRLRFRGKSGVSHEVRLNDRRLAKVLNACQDIPGQELFQYINGEGTYQSLESADVNSYLQEAAGFACSAKDFRTWKASALVLEQLYEQRSLDSKRERRKAVKQAVCHAASALGNSTTICRNYYVHPFLLESYVTDDFAALCQDCSFTASKWMDASERLLLSLLQRSAKKARRR